jgi:hypothetical protein
MTQWRLPPPGSAQAGRADQPRLFPRICYRVNDALAGARRRDPMRRYERARRGADGTTLKTAVNWSPNLGVFAVRAAGVLCAFPAWWTRYLDSRLRRTPGTNPLFAAVFRIKRLWCERCSATCQRRRRPGQARRRQGRLQITAVMHVCWLEADHEAGCPDWAFCARIGQCGPAASCAHGRASDWRSISACIRPAACSCAAAFRTPLVTRG